VKLIMAILFAIVSLIHIVGAEGRVLYDAVQNGDSSSIIQLLTEVRTQMTVTRQAVLLRCIWPHSEGMWSVDIPDPSGQIVCTVLLVTSR
jgi:hypothetical protein